MRATRNIEVPILQRFRLVVYVRVALLGFAIFTGASFVLTGASWLRDRAVLSATLNHLLGNKPIDIATVALLNDWVYHNHGFRKNRGYFIFPQLGPTPLDVLENGGDCADKSRLLSALLAVAGVRSGLFMMYSCHDCPPIHTAVEVRLDDTTVVADPTWDVDYIMSRKGLAQSNYAEARVAYFRQIHAADPKIKLMPPGDADFRYTKAINFDANIGMKIVFSLVREAGVDTDSLMRPNLLEDPKLVIMFVTASLTILATIICSTIFLLCPGGHGAVNKLR